MINLYSGVDAASNSLKCSMRRMIEWKRREIRAIGRRDRVGNEEQTLTKIWYLSAGSKPAAMYPNTSLGRSQRHKPSAAMVSIFLDGLGGEGWCRERKPLSL